MTNLKNPFQNEQWLASTLIAQNPDVVKLSKQTYKNFYLKTKKMSQSKFNFVQFLTKHTFIAGFVVILIFGTVGASAAEAFAPKEFKPSQIINKTFNPKDFESNKQPDKNPFTALKPDEKNDVVISEKCDLAVKYPKKVEDTKIQIYNNLNPDLAYTSFIIYDGYQYTEQYSNENGKLEAEKKVKLDGLYIDCVDSQYQKNKLTESRIYPENYTKPLTKSELQQQTGWFLTEADITNIRFWDNGYGSINLSFDFKGKTYNMNYTDPTARANAKEVQAKRDTISFQTIVNTGYFDRPGVFGNQIQIQFSSLVTNEANQQIIEKPKTQPTPAPETPKPVENPVQTPAPTKQTLFADNDNELSTLEKCNLRVKYSKTFGTPNSQFKVAPNDNYQQSNNGRWETFLPIVEGVIKAYSINGNFGRPGYFFDTFCVDGEYKFSEFNSKFSSKNGNGFVIDESEAGKTKYTNLPKSELCKKIGLNSKCENISNVLKIDTYGFDGGSRYYYFSYKSKTYIFDLANAEEIKLQSEFIS